MFQQAVIVSVSSIQNIVMVTLLLQFMFSVIGVQLFKVQHLNIYILETDILLFKLWTFNLQQKLILFHPGEAVHVHWCLENNRGRVPGKKNLVVL